MEVKEFMIARETIPALLCPRKGLTFTHFGMENSGILPALYILIITGRPWKGPSTFELHCSQNNNNYYYYFFKIVSHICFIYNAQLFCSTIIAHDIKYQRGS